MKTFNLNMILTVGLFIVAGTLNSYGTDADKEIPDTGHSSCTMREVSTLELKDLPSELHVYTLSFLSTPSDFGSLALVSKYWRNIIKDQIQGSVVVIGNGGTGKSTLVHLLVGKQLTAKKLEGEWQFTAEERIPNIDIMDGMFVGTRQPSLVFDLGHKRTIWDCCAFNDLRGKDQDFLNALAIYKLLKGNLRVILVIKESSFDSPRGLDFTALINKITEIFPDQDQLQNVLSLVVSSSGRHTDGAIALLKAHIKAGRPRHLRQNGYDLINFLIANPSHVGDFKVPEVEGVYEASENLKQLMASEVYGLNPQVNEPQEMSVSKERWSSKFGYNEQGEPSRIY